MPSFGRFAFVTNAFGLANYYLKEIESKLPELAGNTSATCDGTRNDGLGNSRQT